ncbi:MAG: hypothetical protein J6V78_03615 [Clostridia bacterium]|nr:hypothetical protein [Clostridia bacterium]
MLKVHLSIDDVIYSFLDLIKLEPASVFDVDLFKMLKNLNKEYGAVFTLYCYENYANSYFVSQISAKYWREMAESGFLRLAYHGPFEASEYSVFFKECCDFYKNIPTTLYANRARLHRYSGDEQSIELLKKFKVEELLCRENYSRNFGEFQASYILSEKEEQILDEKCILKNGIMYRKTDVRIEFYTKSDLKCVFDDYAIKKRNDVLVVFTHEKKIRESELLLINTLQQLKEYNVEYIF